MNSRELKFCRTYQATVQPGRSRYYRKQHYADFLEEMKMPDMNVEAVQGVEINMPKDRFYALLEAEERLRELLNPKNFVEQHPGEKIWDDYVKECTIRNECPSVQIAYEKYRNLLNLVDSNYG